MAPSSPGESVRGRKILADLLAPVVSNPRALADALLVEFGSLSGVLAAEPAHLQLVLPNIEAVNCLASITEAMHSALHEQVDARPVLSSGDAVLNYLRVKMGHLRSEEVRVLFVDGALRLVHEQRVSCGSGDAVALPIRSIIDRAFTVDAYGIVLAHNHPSGDARPSRSDLAATQTLATTASAVDIQLVDHIIVARREIFSFRSEGLL